MPISSLKAVSTELGACSAPPQQLFNNLNDQARLSTTAWFPPSTFTFFFLFPRLDKLTTVAPALSSYTCTMQPVCSRGFVRRTEKSLTEG